jgi:hypothetical protein
MAAAWALDTSATIVMAHDITKVSTTLVLKPLITRLPEKRLFGLCFVTSQAYWQSGYHNKPPLLRQISTPLGGGCGGRQKVWSFGRLSFADSTRRRREDNSPC